MTVCILTGYDASDRYNNMQVNDVQLDVEGCGREGGVGRGASFIECVFGSFR